MLFPNASVALHLFLLADYLFCSAVHITVLIDSLIPSLAGQWFRLLILALHDQIDVRVHRALFVPHLIVQRVLALALVVVAVLAVVVQVLMVIPLTY